MIKRTRFKPRETTGIITMASPEAIDIEVFYKGKRVINVHEIVLVPSQMLFDDSFITDKPKVLNWKKKLGC